MDAGLLQNLMTGAGSSSHLIGALVIAMLYLSIGLLSVTGSIIIFRRMFQGQWEQVFWAAFLVAIAAFYLSFAAYFGASAQAWKTELAGVAVFVACAVGGLIFRPLIAVGYVMHGLWDISHSLAGSSFLGQPITEIPLGYAVFCMAYDFPVAYYLMTSNTAWDEPGKFNLYFWRQIL